MGGYQLVLFKRGISAAINLFLILCLGFWVVRLFPGSPLAEEEMLAGEVHKAWASQYGLDQPLPKQFLIFLKQLPQITSQLSFSFPDRTAKEVFTEAFFLTAKLNLLALFSTLIVGYLIAIGFAWFKGLIILEKIRQVVTSVPTLFLAPLMIWYLCFFAGILPWRLEGAHAYFLPVFLLALRPCVGLARMICQKISEFDQSAPAQVHLSQGFSRSRVIFGWGRKESLKPFASQFPQISASILSGSFLIEVLFSAKGLGVLFVESLGNRDFPVLLFLILFYAGMVLVAQLISDLVLFWIDRRTFLDGAN